MPLTDEYIKRYIERGLTACPFCSGVNFHLGISREGAGKVFRDIRCLGCQKIWREAYHLANILYPICAEMTEDQRPEADSFWCDWHKPDWASPIPNDKRFDPLLTDFDCSQEGCKDTVQWED